jgi:hypothetical protein
MRELNHGRERNGVPPAAFSRKGIKRKREEGDDNG